MHRPIIHVVTTLAAALLLSAAPTLLAQVSGMPPTAQVRGSQDVRNLSGGSTEVRLDRLERMLNEQSLSDLVLQVQRLQQEVQDLRGQVEVQQYRMQQMMSRNSFGGFGSGASRPPLPDGDAVLPPAIEELAASSSSGSRASPGSGAKPKPDNPKASPGAVDSAADAAAISASAALAAPPPQQGVGALGSGSARSGTLALPSPETLAGGEREAYRAAFDLLKNRDYTAAKQEFTTMLVRYPRGQYADNGLYWLGEIGYVTKDYAAAMNHFGRLISDYPLSPKLPGAMLKLGYIYYEQRDLEQATRALAEVAERFPDTTEGRLAKGRLEQITRDGG